VLVAAADYVNMAPSMACSLLDPGELRQILLDSL
jgi:hypothetical protein